MCGAEEGGGGGGGINLRDQKGGQSLCWYGALRNITPCPLIIQPSPPDNYRTVAKIHSASFLKCFGWLR